MKLGVSKKEYDKLAFLFFGLLFAVAVMTANPIAATAFGLLTAMFLIEARFESIKELMKHGGKRK